MPREITIDGRLISDDAPAYVVAEIGHNHAGEFDKAIAMVKSAKAAGASAVKFQTRHPKEVYSKAEYSRTTDNPQWMDRVYGVHREKLEFSPEEWSDLFQECRRIGITAFSTPFDFNSVDLLASNDVPAFKVASGDATNIPMIEYIAQIGKPMIISTGGCSIEDVDRIHEAMSRTGTPFAVLQCSCIYPAPAQVLNLRVIEQYRERFPEIVTGLSTHSPTFYSTIAAYTLGGRIFEHHYTNDRDWKGTDNNFSLTPGMLEMLVEGLEEVHLSLGDGQKHQFPEEHAPTIERRKKLIWRDGLPEGHVISGADLSIKCPGNGVQPYELPKLIGSKVLRAVRAEEDVLPEDVSYTGSLAVDA